MGKKRELKKALEKYWRGEINKEELLEVASALRVAHWRLMQEHQLGIIPSNDFSFYDQVLDTTCMVGAVPERYNWNDGDIDLDLYFAMARGKKNDNQNIPAMEMTKWFDTNYHYLVPEFKENQEFKLYALKAVREFEEAKAMGIHTRPVLLGPVSYLLSGRMVDGAASVLTLLPLLLPVYEAILDKLAEAGADWIQMDEPCLVLDRAEDVAAAVHKTYKQLSSVDSRWKIQLTTYFGGITNYLNDIVNCPIDGLHVDLVRAPEQLDQVLEIIRPDQQLSLGVINGRNIWRSDLGIFIPMIEKAITKLGENNVIISSSCSLLHVPFGLEEETELDEEIKSWLCFAKEKMDEIVLLGKVGTQGKSVIADELTKRQAAVQFRRKSEKVNQLRIKERGRKVTARMLARNAPFNERKKMQQEKFRLPLLPTTTIGSFPQTQSVRLKRRDLKSGKLNQEAYQQFLKEETRKCIAFQEEIGLDVLVHGEFERTDMVEYFGEHLDGFVFTKNGWVQSYGSRCVKPPIIYGDVERKEPMTVAWSSFAQSLTKKPMKGMLTGPVTILQWSFVRDDQPRKDTCQQIALAIRDEVADLERAGIHVIQIDEPALREGLPLKKTEWPAYLKWGVDCFRLASAGVKNETQIHTHMCYGDFEDILDAIAAMDADVISIEASRSDMVLLTAFGEFKYPNDIGPGVYDIHSPLVPEKEAIINRMKKAMAVMAVEQLWINPDCGVKTRNWPEVNDALHNMVAAAKELRGQIKISG